MFLTLYKNQLRRAVKLLNPKLDLLENQAGVDLPATASRTSSPCSPELNHENLALLVDFGGYEAGAPGVPFVATQFVDGVTLQSFLHRGDLKWPLVFRLLEQALAGIAYLHENRVMHCDVKPDNIRIRQASRGHQLQRRPARPGRRRQDSLRISAPAPAAS